MNAILKLWLILIMSMLLNPVFAQKSEFVHVEKLNLRSAPDTKSKVLSQATYGQELMVVEVLKSGWKKVQLPDGTVAYVSGKLVGGRKPEAKVERQQEAMVYICNSSRAYAYHRYQCRGLSRCKAGTSSITVSRAKGRGFSACKNCY